MGAQILTPGKTQFEFTKTEEGKEPSKAVKYLLERLCFETPSMNLNGFMHNNREPKVGFTTQAKSLKRH